MHPKLDHWIVYTLVDPRTGQARYVGATSYMLRARLARHLYDARTRQESCGRLLWLRELLAAGLRPEIAELERADSEKGAHEVEEFFVRYLRAIGADLVNETHGGPGSNGRPVSDDTRRAIGSKTSVALSGRTNRPHSEVTIEKIRAAAQRRPKPPPKTEAHRQKLREAWVRRRARMTEVV